MANIMIRRGDQGYVFYMPKRDIEDSIVSIEFDTPEKWGGEIRLGNVERITQESYSIVNLMARYDFTKQLYAQLNINNVFDEEYFAMFDAYDQMTYGAPRSATLKMTYKF